MEGPGFTVEANINTTSAFLTLGCILVLQKVRRQVTLCARNTMYLQAVPLTYELQ